MVKYRDDVMRARRVRMVVFIIFALFCVMSFVIGNAMGTMKIPLHRVVEVLFRPDSSVESQTLWNIRLPRMILCALVGMNLAVSGALLQGVMSNPLADPGIIGISSGAGLFGIFVLVLFPQYQSIVPIVAFIGALLAAMIIYALAWKGGIQPLRVILAGVAVSALFGAGISAILVFYSDRVHGALSFMNGSLSERSWREVMTILPYSIFGLGSGILMIRPMNILLLGDDVARGLGLHVERTRFGATALAALLAASAVSVAGLLGFVGLIVPHSVRLLVSGEYRDLLPGSALLGAGLLMASDTFARMVLSPTQIPVGIVMAVLGVPFFLYLMRR